MKKFKRTKGAKFDAIQIQNGALEQEGKFIAAQIKTMRGYEAKANELAGVELRKAEDNRTTVEKRLADVHAKCKADGFKAFKAKWAADFGRTKLYQILAIGSGKKTHEQVREEERVRKAKQREAVRDNANVPDTPLSEAEGEAIIAKANAVTAEVLAGNGVDPDVSANAMKAAMAEAEVPMPAEAPKRELSPEEISDDELTAAKQWWREHGPNMTDADVAKFRVFISDERQWRSRGHKKAA